MMPGEANNSVSGEAMCTLSRTADDLEHMAKEFHNCRRYGEHADLLIQCDDKAIKCHRLVLGANSRFLRDLLASLPEECPSCSGDGGMALLVLPGVKYEVLQKVLKFLYTGVIRLYQTQIPEVRKLLERCLRVDAKIDLPRTPEEEEEAEMAAAAAAALNIKSEPRDFDDDNDGGGASASGAGGASPPPSGSGTGGSTSSPNGNGTMNGGDSMDASQPGPSNHRSPSDHGRLAEIKADFIPPSPPDSNQGDVGDISGDEEDNNHVTDLNDVSQSTKEANCDEVDEAPVTFQISEVRGTAESPEANTNAEVLIEDESPEAINNDEVIDVEDIDEDSNLAERGSNGGFDDSEKPEPEFLPAPSVISKKTSRSNNAFFATKSTSSGSGGAPKKVIAKRPGGHLRDGGKSAKKAKVARGVDDAHAENDTNASSSDSDSSLAPSPDISVVGEDPDFNLGQGAPFHPSISFDLPNPIPEPPQEGLVIHRGEWVTPAKRNRLLAKRDRPRNDIRKYNYKPFESTITGYSKLSTVAAAEEEVDGEFTCQECGAKFARERSLTSHISRAHNANARWPCPENCGKMLSSQTAIKKHLLSHRPESEWPYQCRLCGKNFQAKGDLPKHWATKRHDKDRPQQGTARWEELIQASVRVPSMSDNRKNTRKPKIGIEMVRRAADDFAAAGPSGIGAQPVAPAAENIETIDAFGVQQPAFPGQLISEALTPFPRPLSATPTVTDQPAFPGNPLPQAFFARKSAPPPPTPPPPPIYSPACPTPFLVVPPSPVPQFHMQVGQGQVPQFQPIYSRRDPA